MIGFYIEKDTFINKLLQSKMFNTTEKVSGVEAKEELMKMIEESNVIFEPDYIPYQFKLPVEKYDFNHESWQIDRTANICKVSRARAIPFAYSISLVRILSICGLMA